MSTIPIRMLNEIQYCERLFHLMHVQGMFEESADTIEGTAQHRKAERRRRKSDTASQDLWGEIPQSLHLGDPILGIVGKLDAVKHEDGAWAPVEGKHSSAPHGARAFYEEQYELSGYAWPNDQIQLCAQGLLLQANGYTSRYGYLYYRGNRQRVRVEFTESLVNATKSCIEKAKALNKKEMPAPLKDANKCFRCSMNYICLPDETNYLQQSSSNIRKIVPSRSDGGVMYVSEHGTRLGKSGETMTITSKEGTQDEIPLKDLVHVTVMGNVQISTQLLHILMFRGISISYLSSHGKFIGMSTPPVNKNIHLRKHQFIKAQHPDISLKLARSVVHAKILNQRTMMRRNGSILKQVLKEMKELAEKSLVADSLDQLRGFEGRAGRCYMEAFAGMLKQQEDGMILMKGRNRRPPKDPANALLSLGYTLLMRDVMAACYGVGIDPMFGFYHCMEAGRPAMALDMMEPFRPLIVDSVVLRVMNTAEITVKDFYMGPDCCQLKKQGRQKFFGAYERRMNSTLTHPIFGYKISYRRVLDLEVKMFARYLEGELKEYHPLTTR
ncbi:CRISPR-associated endonuclease Cas1 [Bacillus sp. FSL W7-1360]